MRRPVLTYANVMSTVGVFIALGGTSYAVTKLPKDSVGSRQLKRGAVATDDIAAGAVTKDKLAAGAVASGPRGPRGEQGPVGAAGTNGVNGANGAPGPSDTIFRSREARMVFLGGNSLSNGITPLSFTLPAGKWLVQASANVVNYNNNTTFRCRIKLNGEDFGSYQATSVGGGAGATGILPVMAAVDAQAPTVVGFHCWHDDAINNTSNEPTRVEGVRAFAVRTGSLDVQ